MGTAFIMLDKGKVERFIGYLKGSFWVPFVASMRQEPISSTIYNTAPMKAPLSQSWPQRMRFTLTR